MSTDSVLPIIQGGDLPTVTGSPKVTVAFKCSPLTKLRLSRLASEQGLTMSELCESIISNFDNNIDGENIQTLRAKVESYECPALLKLFEEQRGESVEYTNAVGCKVLVKIENLENLYEVVINSFKSERP